ncbi:MAG TPA: MFS transporter [Mycobacteriales bacterium]|nr:MFS transporter [Mycobacteriales bacterium]
MELPSERTTSQDARPLLLTLGLPTFGLAFAITILTTYGPTVLLPLVHSPAKVGAIMGGEGALALLVPLVSGSLSDRLKTTGRWGARLPFVIVGAPLAGTGLILLPFAPNAQVAGASILAFYVGYYVYYPPYRAIYADLLPRRLLPRAQSSQAVIRGAGLGLALIAGGLLLSIWTPLPFVVGIAVLGVSTLTLKPVVRLLRTVPPRAHDPEAPIGTVVHLFARHRSLQLFSVANAIWEYSYAGLKFFIVLYVTKGLGESRHLATAVITVVAVAYVVGAPIAGRLAERYGMVRVMEVSAALYGVALCIGLFPTSVTPMLFLLPAGALAGAILMTLPQALAFTLAPAANEGAAAGLVDFSRGIGVVLGPVCVGAAVSGFAHTLRATDGYAIMWPMIGVPILLSLFLLRLIRHRLDAEAKAQG